MSQFGARSSREAHTGPARKVGYRKPPEEHQFKKGVSGNPKGRPKKPAADADDPASACSGWVAKTSNRKVKITENGMTRTVPMKEAILLHVAKKALQGDLVAARIFLNHVGAVEQAQHKVEQRRAERELAYERHLAEQAHRADIMGYAPFEPLPRLGDIGAGSKPDPTTVDGPKDEPNRRRSGGSDPEPAERLVEDTEKQWEGSENERCVIESAIEELETVRACPDQDSEDGKSPERVAAQLQCWTDLRMRLDAFYPSAKQRGQPGFNLQRWRDENIRDDWRCPIFD